MGKVIEKFTYYRLLRIIESEPQYGFRYAHCAMSAISIVMNLAKDALSSGGCCVVLAFHVKNSTNPAKWSRIKGTLADISRCSLIFDKRITNSDHSLVRDGTNVMYNYVLVRQRA